MQVLGPALILKAWTSVRVAQSTAESQLTRAANSAKEMSPDLSQSYLLSQVVTSSSEIQLCVAG